MGKRGNGEGSITRKERQEASEKLTKAMADRDSGLVFDAENQTVSEYLQRWLNDSVRGSVKPVTFENRASSTGAHLPSVRTHQTQSPSARSRARLLPR